MLKEQEDEQYILKLFSNTAVFSGLSKIHLKNILPFSQKIQYPPNTYILREGSEADGFFIIVQGRVEVLKTRIDTHQEYRLSELGTGQCFGEIAVIDQSPRSASIKAIEPTIVLKISIDNIDRIAEMDNLVYVVLLKNLAIDLSKRLRYSNELLVLRVKETK